MNRLKSIPIGAWVALAVLIASLAAIVIKAPPAMWASLAAADPEHIAGVIGLVGSAIAGVVTLVRAAWTGETPPTPPAPTPKRTGREGFSDVLELALILVSAIGAAGLLALSGCGSAASQHRTLNTIADVVNPTYDLAIETCDEAELAIIARPGTTYEQDTADMTAVREVCDRVFAGFDAVRVAHRLARAAVDGGGEALVAEAIAELQEAWAALRALLPEIEGLVA